MLYHILYPLSKHASYLSVFKYITLRSFLAFIIAASISIIFGRKFINFMKKRQFGQIVRDDGPESHLKKAGTPTMGGILILLSVFIACLISGNFSSMPFLITLFVTSSFFALGFFDDYLKIIKKDTGGISAKGKLLWQTATALIAAWWMISSEVTDTKLYFPFVKDIYIDLGGFFYIFVCLVIVGSSNAVNLTDGLDGLAIGPIMTSSGSLGLMAYVAGHAAIAKYLLIPYIPGSGELLIATAAMVGAGVGFLWYNTYPAQIFMGDVGSLSLGGALGTIAVLTKNEILFVIIGGIFVIEALSVIIQVFFFKVRGKRVFRMAPIHHHFELMGWPEPKVIVRFWIVSVILAIISLATLKLR